MLGAGCPDLLAGDRPTAGNLCRERLQRRRVRAGGRLRHPECLQPQLARGDPRQVPLLLLVGAMAEDCPHRVHLRVTGSGVATGRVDLLEDHARRRQRQPRTAVFLGNERCEPPGLGQRGDELLGVAVRLERAPVRAREAGAQLAHRGTDLAELFRECEIHGQTPVRSSSRRAMISCWISFDPSPIRSKGASR